MQVEINVKCGVTPIAEKEEVSTKNGSQDKEYIKPEPSS